MICKVKMYVLTVDTACGHQASIPVTIDHYHDWTMNMEILEGADVSVNVKKKVGGSLAYTFMNY